MTSLFLSKSKVIYQTEDKSGRVKSYSTGVEDYKKPIVILANNVSASASEVMIAALRDNLSATIVGEKTYGKGTVQELQGLPNGSAFKFTIKKWLTPKGVWINGIGITPDHEVSLSEDYFKNPSEDLDNQLQSAFIRLVP